MNQYRDFSNLIKPILEQQDILLDEPMKNHTSFRVGGPCDILVTPRNYDQVIEIIKLCVREKVPYYIVGNGSNLLVKDGGIRGVIVNTSKLSNIEVNGEEIMAECGAMLPTVSKRAAGVGLTGLEFASGIPGSIGGAVAMNAGAYNGEISQVIKSALIVDKNGEMKELSKEELELSYRKSAIFKNEYTVLKVVFELKKGDKDKIINRIRELTIKRTERQPLEYPSAGSTFKRPEGYFTGKLIEDAGLKGASIGDAQVSEKHAGFVINKGNARAKDILDLINLVQSSVEEKFGVTLQPEVRIIGED